MSGGFFACTLLRMEVLFGWLIVALLGVIISVGGWLYRRLDRKVDDTNQIIRRELRPNGGDSMFDRVTEIEHRLRDGDHTMKNLATNIQQLLDK